MSEAGEANHKPQPTNHKLTLIFADHLIKHDH